MAERFDVEITHLDGTVEIVSGGDTARVDNGILHIHNNHWNTGGASYLAREHLGSFPLASIRKYRRLPR